MFPVKCKDLLPLDHILIKSIAVRGRLGPLTVWVSNRDEHQRRGIPPNQQTVRLNPKFWTKLYDKTHGASRYEYKELELDQPIRLLPGETRVIYVHSTLPGDEAIVYDNSYYGQSTKRYEDSKILIMSGRAHVSNDVFGQEPIWGWGNAWRDRREFVGRLNYGTVYKLWNPQVQPKFGRNFQDGARALFLCQRRWESPMSMLPDECIFYILNICRWDWFHDDADTMLQRRRREKASLLRKEAAAQTESMEIEVAAASRSETSEGEQNISAVCSRRCKTDRDYTAAEGLGETDDEEAGAIDSEDDVEMEEEEDDDDDDAAFEAFGSDEGEEEEEEEEEEDDDDISDDDEAYRGNVDAFTFQHADSDEEENDSEPDEAGETSRRHWLRRQFARIHALRAIASMEDR
jgi:hypothetical protein